MKELANVFKQRIDRQIALFERVVEDVGASSEQIVHLDHLSYCSDLIEAFGPALLQKNAGVDLAKIFSVSFHPQTQSVIIANRGVTLLSKSTLSQKHFILRHVAAAVYQPAYGLEMVNIGIVGNIYSGPVILRAESACPPAFLFNSQRCNCAYQWASIRELAAHLNEIEPPRVSTAALLERWVESQFDYKHSKHCVSQEGQGVLMIHFDSQAGMGCGFTEGEFCYDLGMRAALRQLGENTVGQVAHTSIKEGYETLGLLADARHQGGYQLTAIILDFLQASKELVCLTNNPHKLGQLKQSGYQCRRVKSLGQVLEAGMLEATQRQADFSHTGIGECMVSFEEEMQRLKQEIT